MSVWRVAQSSTRRRSILTPDAVGITPISGYQTDERRPAQVAIDVLKNSYSITKYRLQQYVPNRIRNCQGSNPILVTPLHLLGNRCLQLPNPGKIGYRIDLLCAVIL
jgi:hypothetical protein